MQPHEERVIEEESQLAARLAKLREFLGNPEQYQQVPREEQERLQLQELAMALYLHVLRLRIQAFSPSQSAG